MIGFVPYTKANFKVLLNERIRLHLFDRMVFMAMWRLVLKSFPTKDFIIDDRSLPKNSVWYTTFEAELEKQKVLNLYEFAAFVVFNLDKVKEIQKMSEAEKKLIAKANLFTIFNDIFVDEFHKLIRSTSDNMTSELEKNSTNNPKAYGTPSNEFEPFVTLPDKAGDINLKFVKAVNKKAIDAIALQKNPGSLLDKQRQGIDRSLIGIIDGIK